MTPDIRALVTEMADELDRQRRFLRGLHDDCVTHPLADRARAALAEPVAPTDEELLAMRSWSSHGPTFDSDLVDFARAILARWGHPTPEATPVARPTVHACALDIVNTLAKLGVSAENLLTLRRAIREPMRQPTPEAAPVATDEERPLPPHIAITYQPKPVYQPLRTAQPPAAPPPAPAGGLVERVVKVIADPDGPAELWFDDARAAIREVAAWMRENEVGYNAVRWLEQEAGR
jgi:hypothetical protein